MSKRELRFSRGIELRQKNGSSVIRGYAAKFNSLSHDLGGFREKIAPGAFTNAIANDDVRALVGHDPDKIIGRNKSGTLELREDESGLYCEVTLPDTSVGRDVAESIKRGDLDGMSFGFGTIEDDWTGTTADGQRLRELRNVKLYDVSVVTYPAYPQTSVSMRSLQFPEGLPPDMEHRLGESDSGAYVVPEGFAGELQKYLKAYGGLRAQEIAPDHAAAMGSCRSALAMHRANDFGPQMAEHMSNAIRSLGGNPDDCDQDDGDIGGDADGIGDDKTDAESRSRNNCEEAKLWFKQQALSDALAAQFGRDKYGDRLFYGPVETYDDHIIAAQYDENYDCNYFSIPYTIGDGGAISFGEPKPVELDWVPASRSLAQLAAFRAASKQSRRGNESRAAKTKKVDGKDLTASDFAYVGDPDKTDTWKLPIHDADHVRNALARFDQTEGIPESEKPAVLAKIHAAAKKFGIEVSEKKSMLDRLDKIRRAEAENRGVEANIEREAELIRQSQAALERRLDY